MKVYLHYEHMENDSKNYTLKLTLPRTWKKGPIKQLKDILIENFNKNHRKEHTDLEEIDPMNYHLEKADGTFLPVDGIVSDFIQTTDSVYLKEGEPQTLVDLGLAEPPTAAEIRKKSLRKSSLPLTENEKRMLKEKEVNSKLEAEQTQTNLEGKTKEEELLQCKNFGCQKKYKESQNHSKACMHHIKPPIFHETRKYWACCPDKIAWDWDSFTAITGCESGRHKNVAEGKRFLGGTDVRKAKEEDYGPKRLNKPTKEKKKSGLDKLSNLRKNLVSIGVKGSLFDETRDQLKQEIVAADENVGIKVWDKVLERMVKKIENAFS